MKYFVLLLFFIGLGYWQYTWNLKYSNEQWKCAKYTTAHTASTRYGGTISYEYCEKWEKNEH